MRSSFHLDDAAHRFETESSGTFHTEDESADAWRQLESLHQQGPTISTSFKILLQAIRPQYARLTHQIWSSSPQLDAPLNNAFRCAILSTLLTLLDDRRVRDTIRSAAIENSIF